MKDLKNKYGEWALVTGASSGIGEEFALRLAENGMNVILAARREDRLKNLSGKIKEHYKVETLVIPVDLAKDDFMPVIIEAVGDREVGILINNAGYGSTGEFIDNDPQFEVNMVKVNCVAPTILTHHYVPMMKERGKGAVIFLGSVAAFQPMPMMAAYAATKVFNRYLGNALWYELKKYGIDVLSLNPGGTNSEFQRISGAGTGPFSRTTQNVVTTAMNALGKRMSVIDGMPNKLVGVFSKILPEWLIVKIAGKSAAVLYEKYEDKK